MRTPGFIIQDIYYVNTSPQVEKEKKKGRMDINLRYVAAVTYLRGDLTFLNRLLNIHTKVISSILRKNEHRRLKRKIALDMCKNGWALHYVVIKINDGVQFYLMAKVLTVRTYNRLNNIDCMQTAMGVLSTTTKVIKSLLLQLFGPYIIT